ncbi:MAG: 50S ribosomal protein L6 [Alphaproteobacteria bacterium]|nr:50S ribosomal protein L6 [Alphaproteobacteria bacterium]
MSRTGKLPVAVPKGVNVDLPKGMIVVKGPKGELRSALTRNVVVKLEDGKIFVTPANDTIHSRAMWGTTRSVIAGLVQGVSEGFTKVIEINGVGFRAAVANGILTVTLGFSHEVKYAIPAGVTVTVDKQTIISIAGADKQLVGSVAAELRSFRKPEPYKGKGVRYQGEYVRMKEGKKK